MTVGGEVTVGGEYWPLGVALTNSTASRPVPQPASMIGSDLDKIFSPRQAAAARDPFAALSPREFQVFSLLVEGTRAKEIGACLGLNPKTIDTYRVNLMRKLDIHDLAGLVKFAIQRDLTSTR